MVARHLGVVEAVGSSPVTQTIKKTVDFVDGLLFLCGTGLINTVFIIVLEKAGLYKSAIDTEIMIQYTAMNRKDA